MDRGLDFGDVGHVFFCVYMNFCYLPFDAEIFGVLKCVLGFLCTAQESFIVISTWCTERHMVLS